MLIGFAPPQPKAGSVLFTAASCFALITSMNTNRFDLTHMQPFDIAVMASNTMCYLSVTHKFNLTHVTTGII